MESDATPTAETRGRISVTVQPSEAEVTIVIADDGCGLPAALADRLTEPYVTTRSKGTGLGLAIVRKIVDDHGGSLRLENGAEAGAVATLVLPTSQAGRREAQRGG